MTVTVIRKNIAGQMIWLLGLVVMSMATGCASRPYPKGGDGQPGMVIFVPFILANEVALYAIEKKKQTAAEAHEAELLSQVHRFKELKVLSVKGDAAIQCELAFCYLRGRGATRDVFKGTFWLQKSGRQGFAEAQNELGLCYYNETGVNNDNVEACAWWSLAAPVHEQAKASLDYVVADTEKHMTTVAFAEFSKSVRRRAAEIKSP
jgi:hypothetical protein